MDALLESLADELDRRMQMGRTVTTLHIGAPPRVKTADQLRAERRARWSAVGRVVGAMADVTLYALLFLAVGLGVVVG